MRSNAVIERGHGIEPHPATWKAAVLPLHQLRLLGSVFTTNP